MINLFSLVSTFLIAQFPVWEGVVTKSVKLKDGNRFLPGDRVLVIKKKEEKLPIFTPEGKFYQIDSSQVVLIRKWVPPHIGVEYFGQGKTIIFKEPSFNSESRKHHFICKNVYFAYAIFNEKEKIFWAATEDLDAIFNEKEKIFWTTSEDYEEPEGRWLAIGWYPFTTKEVSKFISTFIHKNDSTRTKFLFEMGDYFYSSKGKFLKGERGTLVYMPDGTTKCRLLYQLAYEWSEKSRYKEYGANSLLMLAWFYLKIKDIAMAMEILNKVIQNYPKIKSIMGRADAYATFKLLEIAKQNNDTTKVCSLAKHIIFNFPNEDGAERVVSEMGGAGHLSIQNRSLWFDIEAANILMDFIKEDDEKLVENANLLLASTNIAVKLIGYENLIPFYYRKYERDKALFYAKGAIVLPHFRKWETKIQHSDIIIPDEWVDFKKRFLDKLDYLLPLSYLKQLYEFAYTLKDTSVVKDAARWFINKTELGVLPPRSDLTDKITLADGKEWFKKAFLSSIDSGPLVTISAPCTLFFKRPHIYSGKLLLSPKKLIERSNKFYLLLLEDSLIKVKTMDNDVGWIKPEQLKGNCQFKDIPAITAPKPVLYYDFTKDGVKDLGLEDGTIINGKNSQHYYPFLERGSWVVGLTKDYFLLIKRDTIWVQNYNEKNINGFYLDLKEKEGKSNPFASFFYSQFIRDEDTIAWFLAGDEKGIQWVRSFAIKKGERFNFCQADTNIILYNLNRIIFISSRNGKINWQKVFAKKRSAPSSGSDIFINQDGFALFEDDSLVFSDFTGKRIFAVKNEGFTHFPSLPLFPSYPKWGRGRLCPLLPKIPSKYIPAIKGQTLTLISVKDGIPYKSFEIPERFGEFFYDSKGFYVSREPLFRAYDWEGNLIKTINLPYISFPIWDKDKIVFYWSQPLGILLNAKFAEKFK